MMPGIMSAQKRSAHAFNGGKAADSYVRKGLNTALKSHETHKVSTGPAWDVDHCPDVAGTIEFTCYDCRTIVRVSLEVEVVTDVPRRELDA